MQSGAEPCEYNQNDMETNPISCEQCNISYRIGSVNPTRNESVSCEHSLKIVGVDFVGLLAVTKQGHCYIRTFQDHFTC